MAALAEMMDHHESDLPLVDIFAIVPFCAFELLSLKVQQIVLNLKCHP